MDGGALGDVQEARRANSCIDAAVDLDTGLDAEEAGLKALGSEALGVHVEVVDSGGELRVMPHGLDMRHLSEDGIEGIISIVADLIAERFLIVMPTTTGQSLKRRIIIRICATELLGTHPKARDNLPEKDGHFGTEVDKMARKWTIWQGWRGWHGDCNIQGENV